MQKLILDTNILYYDIEENITEKLLDVCTNIYWSEVSFEELTARATDELKFKRLQNILKKAIVKPIVPEALVFGPEE